jgi:hypothetical protein
MTREEMQRHAEDWIAAWNRRDLDAVMAHFDEDARFTSPRAVRFVGRPTVFGKAALRAYWAAAVETIGSTKFYLDHIVCDVARREMLVLYDRFDGERRVRACELMRFDEKGRQIEGEAMFGAEVLST